MAQSVSSLQRSGSSGFWGAADAVGALLSLQLLTQLGHPERYFVVMHNGVLMLGERERCRRPSKLYLVCSDLCLLRSH
jgi:hypothetical protein